MKKPELIFIILITLIIVCGSACKKQEKEPKEVYFQAKVLEVYENSILVSPLEKYPEAKSSDKIVVSFGELKPVMELKKGDTVGIVYAGIILESYPAQINSITDIILELPPEI